MRFHIDTSDGTIKKNSGNPFDVNIRSVKKYNNIESIELQSVEIPVGFYNIRSPFNTFTINGITYTIPPGNYDSNSLLAVMNSIFKYGIFSVTNSIVQVSSYVTNGLVAYWDLSTSAANIGDVLTSIPDLAGGNYNLVYTSGTPSLQFNTSPKRIVFPSSRAYYDVPYTLSYTNGVTFEMDCIIRANAGGYTPVSLFWQDTSVDSTFRLHLSYLSNDSPGFGSAGWTVTTKSSGPGTSASISPTLSIADNTIPYHIVLTGNPSGVFTLYVNSTNIGTVTLSLFGGPGLLRIGTYAGSIQPYNQVGAFLMGRVYNRVLSQTEVITNYNIASKNRGI